MILDLSDDAQLPWLEDRGITLIRGHARLSGVRKVTVGDEEIEAKAAEYGILGDEEKAEERIAEKDPPASAEFSQFQPTQL